MRTLRRSSLCLLLVLVPSICAISNVTWLRPTDGDVYEPGQSITGQWSTTAVLYSPSFRLCSPSISQKRNNEDEADGSQDEWDGGDSGDEDNCGSEVWPTVQHANGSYQITLSVPNVTSQSEFYLELRDDEGTTAASPSFALRPAVPPAANPSDLPSKVAASIPPPVDSSISTASSASQSQSPLPPPPPASPSQSPPYNRDADAASTNPNINALPTSSPNPNPRSNSTQPLPNLMQTHMPAPAAAYAVPLSLVGFVALSALILCIYHRRRLRSERTAENEKLSSASVSRASTMARYPTRIWKAAFGNLAAVGRGLGTIREYGGRGLVRGLGTIRELRYGYGESRVVTPSASRRSSIVRIRDNSEKKDDIYTSMYVPGLHYQHQHQHQRPRHQPRQHTRDSYSTPRGPRRYERHERNERMVPARQFREVGEPTYNKFARYATEEREDGRMSSRSRRVSPSPSHSSSSSLPPRVPSKEGSPHVHGLDAEGEVLSHYMQPSPLPPISIAEPTPPRRVHARRSARTDSNGGYEEDGLYPDVYAEVARRLPPGPQ